MATGISFDNKSYFLLPEWITYPLNNTYQKTIGFVPSFIQDSIKYDFCSNYSIKPSGSRMQRLVTTLKNADYSRAAQKVLNNLASFIQQFPLISDGMKFTKEQAYQNPKSAVCISLLFLTCVTFSSTAQKICLIALGVFAASVVLVAITS